MLVLAFDFGLSLNLLFFVGIGDFLHALTAVF